MSEIRLNEIEQRLVKHVAKLRYENNRKNDTKNTFYGDRDPIAAEKEHYGAEIAFCKLFNIYPDINATNWERQDCYTVMGNRVDIKHTTRTNGRLLVKVEKDWYEPPDYFAMMIGKFPVYRFVGFMRAEELMQESRIDYSLPAPAYVAQQAELSRSER